MLKNWLKNLRARNKSVSGPPAATPAPNVSAVAPVSRVQSSGPAISHSTGRVPTQPRVDAPARFVIEPEVAERFNAYATAAYPYEIGGMLRVVQDDRVWRAIDVKIFKQEVTPTYFELDDEASAAFRMQLLLSGKKDEIPEWRSLIHSHPSMTPFMSGTDRENIERLAGNTFAFSVICSAHPNPANNYYAVHYCQAAPVKAMIHSLPHRDNGLAGIAGRTDQELAEIEAEVAELCVAMRGHNRAVGLGTNLVATRDGVPEANATEAHADGWLTAPQPTQADDEKETGFEKGLELSDDEYELVDMALSWLRDRDRSSDTLEAALDTADACEAISDHDQLGALRDGLELFARSDESSDLTGSQDRLLRALIDACGLALDDIRPAAEPRES